MNYYELIINELNQQLTSQIEYFKECEEDEKENVLISISAIEFCIKYFNTRFSNNLRYYNYDKSKAYDEFSAKKAMEYLNIYTEEFFFLHKEETQNNFTFRKQLRCIIHILYSVIN